MVEEYDRRVRRIETLTVEIKKIEGNLVGEDVMCQGRSHELSSDQVISSGHGTNNARMR